MKTGWRIGIIFGFASVLLVWWTVQHISLEEVWLSISQLSIGQITSLILLNLLIILLFTSRWWLILKASGYTVPYLSLTGYRLASFAVSYFTPGTQFGGEPLQVHLLSKKHHIPSTTALASVALDKLLELIANFSFLSLGLWLILTNGPKLTGSSAQGWLFGINGLQAVAWLSILISLPLIYLFLLWRGRFPFAEMSRRLPTPILRTRLFHNLPAFLASTERQISTLFRLSPRTISLSGLLSIVIWVLMGFEFWLMIRFLGNNLGLVQLITVLTAARLAFLMPLPGGIGVLEASQVLAMQALGLSPVLGISISLLIRTRDVSLGLVGLWLGAVLTPNKPLVEQGTEVAETFPGTTGSYPIQSLKEV
jgi:uncharacterized protein (TIRG00374 family)